MGNNRQVSPRVKVPVPCPQLSDIVLPDMAGLRLPEGYSDTSAPLDQYLASHVKNGATLLSKFDDSLMDVAVNTRKAYNTDVWIALVVKFFRDWDFPRRYDQLASELLRLEALRRLGVQSSPTNGALARDDDPLRLALHAFSSVQSQASMKPHSEELIVTRTADSRDQPFRMALRGSFISTNPDMHLERVCINSTDRKIVHYLFGRFGQSFDVGFWNHFFSLDSLGRIFREQEASGNSATTLARKMASLQRFEEFLHRSGQLTMPNLFMQRRPRVNPTAQIVLRGDELQQIARYLDQLIESDAAFHRPHNHALALRDRAMFSILDQYLIRASALCNLTLRDIDLRRNTIRVVEKGRKERVFPLEGDAETCLRDYLEIREEFLERYTARPGHEHSVFHTNRGMTMNARSLSRIINQRAEEAGIKAQVGSRSSIGAHVIRRSGGTRYIAAGAPIEAVSQVMNHKNIMTTWHYVGDAAIDLSEKVFKKR